LVLSWLRYFTYHLLLVLAPNYKPNIFSLAKVRNVCYSLAELYVKSVYLGGGVHKFHETFEKGHKL
jgi:hypothetical protein